MPRVSLYGNQSNVSSHQHRAGGVPEHVRAEVRDADLLAQRFEHLVHGGLAQSPLSGTLEYEIGAGLLLQFRQGFQLVRGQRVESVLSGFQSTTEQGLAVPIDVNGPS